MEQTAVIHYPYSQYCYGLDQNNIVLRIKVKKNDIKAVTVLIGDRMSPFEKTVSKHEMALVASDFEHDYFESHINVKYERLRYYFILTDYSNNRKIYSNYWFYDADKTISNYFEFHFNHKADLFITPQWVKSCVIYHIFPDSFATDYRHIEVKKDYKEKYNPEKSYRIGGTLKGIIKNLDYIKDLGANAIYLNPIFVSKSYHKYNIDDYYHIDPNLGTDNDFKELVQSAHSLGIKVILDGVFNHTGTGFFAFADILKYGQNSRYIDWYYDIKKFPVEKDDSEYYTCFAYSGNMPKLNTANPEVVKYFCDVAKYWIQKYDIDGWRLDVANELNLNFWRIFRQTVKLIKSDIYLVGEIWDDANTWMQGDMFDGVMNYRLKDTMLDFFARGEISAQQFGERLDYFNMRYHENGLMCMYNFLDSHDCSRFYDECQNKQDYLLALVFLAFYPGACAVYYGDEIGIMGKDDNESFRNPMQWQDVENDIFKHFKNVLSIRNKFQKLMSARYKSVFYKDRAFVFKRFEANQALYIGINIGGNNVVFDIDDFELIMGDKIATLSKNIIMQSKGYFIITKKEKNYEQA